MMSEIVFKTIHYLIRPDVIRCYNDFQKSQWQPFEMLKIFQEEQLRRLIDFAYRNVPYYTNMFNSLGLKPTDINTIESLEKLPILTKKDIKKNWQELIPKNIKKIKYVNCSTGGSTGEPLKYRMSTEDNVRGVSLLYRGWGYGGYKLGDKVSTIAGSSLISNAMPELKKKIRNYFLNFRHYSSYDMSDENLFQYFRDINGWKPKFFRGYASSIYLFAKFMSNNNLKFDFQPEAIFTTSEKLFPGQRKFIETTFGASVYDNYGLNDGGVSAYECSKHSGMHVDMERAIMEVVDNEGRQIFNKEGRILATSLYNFALPFIRYDTGDLGILSDERCACGRQTFMLKELLGRTTDFLKFNGVIIGSPVLTVLMGKFDIEQYQIIQEKSDSITIRIVKGQTYNPDKDEQYIRKSFYSHVGKIDITFEYVDLIPILDSRKHKFIINYANFYE